MSNDYAVKSSKFEATEYEQAPEGWNVWDCVSIDFNRYGNNSDKGAPGEVVEGDFGRSLKLSFCLASNEKIRFNTLFNIESDEKTTKKSTLNVNKIFHFSKLGELMKEKGVKEFANLEETGITPDLLTNEDFHTAINTEFPSCRIQLETQNFPNKKNPKFTNTKILDFAFSEDEKSSGVAESSSSDSSENENW